MNIVKVRRYLCIICKNTPVFERITEHTCEGEIPDQSNCDLSTYSDHRIVGGKLLSNRPIVPWEIVLPNFGHSEAATSPGGICHFCLATDEIVAKLVKDGHIRFVTLEN